MPAGYGPSEVRDLDGAAMGASDFRLEGDNPRPGTLVVTVHGDLDLHSADQLGDLLVEAVERDLTLLVVDLSRVEFVDSQGLGALLRATRRFGPPKERFRLVVPAPEIRRIFEITALDQVFPLDESREAALAAGSSTGPDDPPSEPSP